MEFTRLRGSSLDDNSLSITLSNWSEELIELIEDKVFSNDFKQAVDLVFNWEGEKISRLTDEEREEQLEVCSQIKGVFLTMGTTLEIYLNRANRNYDVWKARLYNKAEDEVVDRKFAYVAAGKMTKSGISISKEDIKNQFLIDNEKENEQWNRFIEKIKQALDLMKNIVADIENRSMTLMSLRKREQR